MLSLWLPSCYPRVEVLYQRANPKWRFRSPGHVASPLCHGQISHPPSCHFSRKQGLRRHGAPGQRNDCNKRKVTAWREPWGMSLSVSTKLSDQGIAELSHIQTRRTGKLKREKSADGQWLPHVSRAADLCVPQERSPRMAQITQALLLCKGASILMLGYLFKNRIPKG